MSPGICFATGVADGDADGDADADTEGDADAVARGVREGKTYINGDALAVGVGEVSGDAAGLGLLVSELIHDLRSRVCVKPHLPVA